jgi:hypothetical protein
MSSIAYPKPEIWTPDYGKIGESLRLPKWAKPWERTKEDVAVEAAAFDAGTKATGNSASSLSFTHTPVGTPTAVILGYFCQKAINSTTGDAPSAAPTYGGTSTTLVVSNTDTTSHLRIGWYYLASPAAGAQTAAINWAASQSGCGLVVITVTGDAASAPASSQVATGAGNSTSGTVTPVAPGSNDLVVMLASSNTSGAGWTTGSGMSSGQVQIFIDNSGNNDWVSDYRPGSSGTGALTHAVTTGTWFMSALTLPAAGGGTSNPKTLTATQAEAAAILRQPASSSPPPRQPVQACAVS